MNFRGTQIEKFREKGGLRRETLGFPGKCRITHLLNDKSFAKKTTLFKILGVQTVLFCKLWVIYKKVI